MKNHSQLVGMMAQTSIHAGAGQSLGAIDLPIQREGHSGWPCIYGSAVKGALRARAEADELEPLDVIFGPDTNNASEHAGSLLVGDARLLLLPIRSLTGHFKWVTCPAILQRLGGDMDRAGYASSLIKKLDILAPTEGEDEAFALAHSAKRNEKLFLEEYLFTLEEQSLSDLCQVLAHFVNREKFIEHLEDQLVVVSNDMFTYLATYATPVAPHISIESKTKVVRDGALWYEETLPPETLLYSLISAQPARKEQAEMKSSERILRAVNEALLDNKFVQFGGNETVGMGWCHLKVVQAHQEKEEAP